MFYENKHVVLPYIRMPYAVYIKIHHILWKQLLIVVYIFSDSPHGKFVSYSFQDEDLKWVEENIPSSMADV